ncbi:MAG TPA: aminoacyl-tRNA hydrolase [Desulfobacteraceae bacterium]|nr:aminoacyl-tRNA hydrolase [Desulfobacteraceae bacterium]
MIRVTPDICIHEREIKEEFIFAAGPGGQNVNKVATAVQIRFDVRNSPSLSGELRERLMSVAGKRVTGDGVIVIKAKRFRSQDKNRKDAVNRLIDLIRRAAVQPIPRRKTKPTAISRERRLEEKHRRGRIKRDRISPPDPEDY